MHDARLGQHAVDHAEVEEIRGHLVDDNLCVGPRRSDQTCRSCIGYVQRDGLYVLLHTALAQICDTALIMPETRFATRARDDGA